MLQDKADKNEKMTLSSTKISPPIGIPDYKQCCVYRLNIFSGFGPRETAENLYVQSDGSFEMIKSATDIMTNPTYYKCRNPRHFALPKAG